LNSEFYVTLVSPGRKSLRRRKKVVVKELLTRPWARLRTGGTGQAGLCGGALARTGVLFLDRRREMPRQEGALLEHAVDTPPMLHKSILPALRVLATPG
jgi:hypothetical protein